MARLPLIMGLFLALAMSALISTLSLLAKVTLATLLFRTLTSFFLFGILGAVTGSALEVLLMPATTKKETENLKKEIELDQQQIETELGDLLSEIGPEATSGREENGAREDAAGFQPATFPRYSDENGKAVSRGDSVVVS
ncbi:hypothetical protein KBA41_01245 [Candidatus Ozemobacteraceae bacterium]|nr:hypothetical protein [Candidatus Ozemobacteraceae bacterium]